MTDPLGLPSFTTGTEHPKKRDPDYEMAPGLVRQLGKDFASHGDDMTALSKKTQSIDLPGLTFGAIGYGLVGAHNGVRDSTADALAKGKDVLESWRTALNAAADYNDLAEESSKTKGGKEESFGAKMPKVGGMKTPSFGDPGGGKGLDLPDSKLPDSKLPDSKLPDSKLPDRKLPDSKLPDSKLPDRKLPDSKLPDSQLPDSKLPDSQLPGSQLPDSKLPDSKLPDTTLPDSKLPDTGELDKKLTNPIESKLSSYDPKLSSQDLTGRGIPQPTMNQPTTSLPDPRSGGGTGTAYGAGGGTGSGGGLGAAGAGAGARGMGAGGMPMLPFAPGMGGAAGEQDKDREGSGLLKGDPADWEDDQDIAPPVLGKE
ncbi:hypothetical protein [Nonomuraea dietziae]|uniref:hypothetical protein n=1 Tax=Nonomuraea dietziae TaxID=65515 RepID=UPI0033FFE070